MSYHSFRIPEDGESNIKMIRTTTGVFYFLLYVRKKKSCRGGRHMHIAQTIIRLNNLSLLELLLEDLLEGDGVSSKLADTLAELVDGHGVLVEVETEGGLVVEVRLLLEVELGGVGSVELLGNLVLAVVELLEEVGLHVLLVSIRVLQGLVTYGDSEVVAASELGDLTNVSEGSAHDDGLVAELLVVVVNLNNGLDTRVLLLLVLLLVVGLVPVKDTANEGRDEEGTGLSGSDGLNRREHQSQVGVDVVLGLQDVSSLDTLVGRGDLDENAVLGDTGLLVELLQESAERRQKHLRYDATHVDDTEGLLDTGVGVEGESGVNLGRDLAGDDLKDLLAELDKESVKDGINLVVDALAIGVLLSVGDSVVNKLGILSLLRGCQDQGRVGGSILRLVLVNGSKVTRVADDNLEKVLVIGRHLTPPQGHS